MIKIFSKEFIIKDLERRRKEKAEELWITIEEYNVMRKNNINKVQAELKTVRKKWNYNWVHIKSVWDFNNIKWWLVELWTDDESIVIKAYITEKWSKPRIVCDYDRLTYAEKDKMRKTVYSYFNSMKK